MRNIGRSRARAGELRAAVLVSAASIMLAACGQAGSGSGELPGKDSATSSSPSAAAIATAAPSSEAKAPDPASSALPSAAAADTASAAPGRGADSPAPSAQAAARSAAPTAEPAPTAVASATASASATAAPTATATAAAALDVQGAKTQEAAFSVWMQSAKSYKVGQSGSVEVVVVPKGEFHCNESYPYKVKMNAAPAGVSFAQDVVRGASVTPARASIRVPFTATAAGDARISGKFSFSVCKADQCVIDSREVAASIKIE